MASFKTIFTFSLLVILLFPFLSCREKPSYSKVIADQYDELDKEIQNSRIYEEQKEKRIETLKQRIAEENSEALKKELTDWLISEYEAYISDSALFYINKNLANPLVIEDKNLKNSLLIKKADIAAHAGLFNESYQILESINKHDLDKSLLENYYVAYTGLYQYESEYATNSEYTHRYEQLREKYIDSVGRIAAPLSINYVVNQAAALSRKGQSKEAEEMLFESLGRYPSGDRNYSILASILADVYKNKGDKENFQKYITLSAISDIKGAVKENMAIRAVATECYEAGDLERADRYLRKSFADANFYSARMRNAQSSRMLPVIGEAYNSHQKSLNHQLRILIIFISILALGFILIAVFAFLQVKKVKNVNQKTKRMLDEVSMLSKQLSVVNGELSIANNELKESNTIKEEYAVLFMEYCSLAISTLQKYQQTLKVAAAQGNMANLIKKIDSATFESKIISEFYSRFDEAVLNLYPQFVDKFNALLRQEERITLKPKEGLNTEMRVFALIKIGITDSEKIAKFLRCSITTVYTYRSKMRKKALDPDSFEADILTI